MTKCQAELAAINLRASGWPIVSVQINDDGTWCAVAEDWRVRDGWLTQRIQAAQMGAPGSLKIH